jgi:hypothetical protein
MTTAYTSLLGFALPVTGELSGTWGDTVNDGITKLLDSAVAGTTTITVDADVTLTTTTGASNTSRQAIILWTAGGTATRTIFAPNQSKIYTVINASSSTQSIILAGVSPVTTGVTIAKGESALCAWNGSDFIKISNTAGPGTFTNLTVTGNTTLGDADTDTITQAASYVTGTQLKSAKTATNTLSLAAYDVDGTAYTNLITLTASNTPTLALTSTGVGTINNMSIGATTASTGAFTTLTSNGATTFTAGTASTTTGTGTLVITGGLGVSGRINAANFDGIVGANTAAAGSFTTLSASSTVTLSGGTANGVAFLNGSNVLTTGSALVFDGTNFSTTGNATLGGASKATDTQLNFSADTGTQRIYLERGSRSLVFYDVTSAIETYRIAGITGAQTWTVGGTRSMDLTSTGLGIGTSSPFQKLEVIAPCTSFTNPQMLVGNSSSQTTGQQLWLGYNTTAGAGFIQAVYNGTGYKDLIINPNGGNLGLGVTPSAWSTSVQFALQVYTAGVSGNGGGNTASRFTHGCYLDGSTWRYQYTGVAPTRYEVVGANAGSTHSWSIAAGGTAGNAITFTQAMTLDASGNLGIGTTSPIPNAGFTNVTISGSSGGTLFFAKAGAQKGYLLGQDNDIILASTEASGIVRFFTGGNNERARIDSSGNLGIGTSLPLGLLNIKGSNGQLVLNNGASSGGMRLSAFTNAGTANGYLAFEGYSSEYGRFDASGNLLVGQTSNYVGETNWVESKSGYVFAANNTGSANNRNWIMSPNGSAAGSLDFIYSSTNTGWPNAAYAMSIDSSGNLLVGATSAYATEKFRVATSSTEVAFFGNDSNTSGYNGIRSQIGSGGNNTSTWHFRGETRGVANWYLYGNGTTSYSSDSRLKKNIETTRDGYLNDLMQLRVVKYNWINNEDTTPKELGLIAQEVEQVFPNLVQEHDIEGVDGQRKHIKHSVMEFILIKAIQELKSEFDAYKASHP